MKPKNQQIDIVTNLGTITIELFTSTMPETTMNFYNLAETGFYNGVIFHRVIKDFMIQGGDPTGTGTGGPGYKIDDEFTKKNENLKGTIAMANAGPNTGGSQFFINTADNRGLDDKHPVFGKVIKGMDVVEKISQAETDVMDKPKKDVTMEKVVVK